MKQNALHSRNGNVFEARARLRGVRAICEQAQPNYVTSARIVDISMCGVAVATFRVFALEKQSTVCSFNRLIAWLTILLTGL